MCGITGQFVIKRNHREFFLCHLHAQEVDLKIKIQLLILRTQSLPGMIQTINNGRVGGNMGRRQDLDLDKMASEKCHLAK